MFGLLLRATITDRQRFKRWLDPPRHVIFWRNRDAVPERVPHLDRKDFPRAGFYNANTSVLGLSHISFQVCRATHFGENSRGANSTHPSQRHREAPCTQARQAAPDWARARSVVCGALKIRGFLASPQPKLRKINKLDCFLYIKSPNSSKLTAGLFQQK